jgi:hypothetical protein
MLAITIVSLLILAGYDRLPNMALALVALLAFVVIEPALLVSGVGAFLVAGAFLYVSLQWFCPVLVDGIKPVKVLWVTPRFTLALAYA